MCLICYSTLIMLNGSIDHLPVGEQLADLIAVMDSLRDDLLEAIAAEPMAPNGSAQQLTVDQMARRLAVSRSTVYAHWREWGGYKLGAGRSAPIRFDTHTLPSVGSVPQHRLAAAARGAAPNARRPAPQRQDLMGDAPRLAKPVIDVLGV
jgi:hypothetical protein